MKSNQTELFDIDAHLAKLSGESNYMNSLSQITGDIFDVNMSYWKPRSDRVGACDNNIEQLIKFISSTLMKRYSDATSKYSEFMALKDAYLKEHEKMKMSERAIYEKRKGLFKISSGYHPQQIVKSEWFLTLRKLEKGVNTYLSDILPKDYSNGNDDPNEVIRILRDAERAVMAKHPEFKDIKKILGVEPEEKISEAFIRIKVYATVIINTYMNPAYDVKLKIMQNYDKLDKIFKTKGAKEMLKGNVTETEEVISVLEKFIIAKYRKEVTGDSSHYTKLFMSIVGDNDVSAMSGPRILELMDAIDIELINSNQSAYSFAKGAKGIIKDIVTGKAMSAEEAITDIKNLFDTSENPRVKEIEETDNNNDIL